MQDSFLTIASACEGELREKASKFFAFAFPVETELEAEQILHKLRKLHAKANHICYAYRLGIEGQVGKVNDDGEPSGTAGKPIFGQILSHNLSDIAIFVVRYFGGTKLGTSGLINAYKESANLAIQNAVIIKRYLYCQYRLSFEYEFMGVIMNAMKILSIEIVDKDFMEAPSITVMVKKNEAIQLIKSIKARLLDFDEESIKDETEVPYCKIEMIKEVKR